MIVTVTLSIHTTILTMGVPDEASNTMNNEAFKIEEINMKEISMKNGFVDNLTTSDETTSDSMDVVDEIQENHDDGGTVEF